MGLKCKSFEMDEEREEGELSDEELEDVSDSSISLGSIILCDTNLICREPFKELSLTSVSDDSSDSISITEISSKLKSVPVPSKLLNHGTYRHYCKHKKIEDGFSSFNRFKYKKHRHSKSKYQTHFSEVSSSSSESEQYISDKRVLRQLRDAVRISSTKKNPNCSLRSRIKRMIEPCSPNSKHSNTDNDQELESLRDQALKTKSLTSNPSEDVIDAEDQTSNITDDDLINLRLIALQSAVLKKHENRRKRKEQQEMEKKQEENNISVNNEEDSQPKTDNNNVQLDDLQCVEISEDKLVSNNENNDEIDEVIDSENMPACVTESKTEPIADVKNNFEIEKLNPKLTAEEDEDILRAMLLTSISKKISNKIISKPVNVKTIENKSAVINKNKPSKNIVSSIVKAPNVPVKRLVINVDSDSDSDSNPVIVKKKEIGSKSTDSNKYFEQNLSKFLKEARIKSEIQQQSDISKHLPRSQQIEYRHLKRKLQHLSKLKSLPKVKRLEGDENKRIRLNSMSKKNISRTKLLNPLSDQLASGSPNGKKQITNKIDRLHIKGKYEGLAPLMLKISEARTARDKAQTEVKRLINELRNARVMLTSTHQNYTLLIQELLQSKAVLDKRTNILPCSENQESENSNVTPIICTSTPYKQKILPNKESVCEISNILTQNITIPQETQVQIEEPVAEKINEAKDLPNIVSVVEMKESNIEVQENIEVKMEVQENIEIKMEVEEKLLEEGYTKYKSPLDHIQENSEQTVGNPLLVLCPYDLLGVCRDPDCTYRH